MVLDDDRDSGPWDGFFGHVAQGSYGLLGKVIEAIGRVAEGIATNADPIAQVVSLGLAALTINFFLTTEPYKTILAKTKIDALLNAWIHYISGLVDLAAKDLGRDDTGGLWGITVVNSNGDSVDRERWYTNEASRKAALLFLNIPGLGIAYGDLQPNGPGTAYAPISRYFTPGGGFVTSKPGYTGLLQPPPAPPLPPGARLDNGDNMHPWCVSYTDVATNQRASACFATMATRDAWIKSAASTISNFNTFTG